MDAQGDFYGTTVNGGDTTNCFLGCGMVFEITLAGTERVLYRFTGSPDGVGPYGGLVLDSQGKLYGTATFCGQHTNCSIGCGVVWEITP